MEKRKPQAGFIAEYSQEQYEIIQISDGCLIVTPYLNADFAPVEIYIQENGQRFRLSDAGEALHQLFVNGLTIEGNRGLYESVTLAAELNDVQFQSSELFVEVDAEHLGDATQRLANTIQAVSYLIYKKSHRTKLKFEDEVEQFLIANEVVYDTRYNVKGQASNHTIPFYVNSSRNVLIEPLTATTISSARAKAKKVGYQWLDLRNRFSDLYKYAVLLDDKTAQRRSVWDDEEAFSPLGNYSTVVLTWGNQQGELLEIIKT